MPIQRLRIRPNLPAMNRITNPVAAGCGHRLDNDALDRHAGAADRGANVSTGRGMENLGSAGVRSGVPCVGAGRGADVDGTDAVGSALLLASLLCRMLLCCHPS
jgi:hypothetical protein